jgi:hypothetical protein
MKSLRITSSDSVSSLAPCSRCAQGGQRWDRIAAKSYCPNCEEALALGEASPLVERTEPHGCAVCGKVGTLCYQTFPLHAARPVEIDLCAEHLRGLMGRRLSPHAFHQLRRQLYALGLEAEAIFLLHGAFYDLQGRALQPAGGAEED